MEHFLETWGYLAVFVLSFISSMGLPVGAEVAIIYGGVLASGQIAHEPHHLNVIAVIAVAVVAEVVGSLAGYLIGYFGGRPLVDRFGKYVLLSHRDLDRAEAWPAVVSPWCSSDDSSRSCDRSSRLRPAWAKWPSGSSSCSP
jgi:membrane protein DedA with SNARE-associated domain